MRNPIVHGDQPLADRGDVEALSGGLADILLEAVA